MTLFEMLVAMAIMVIVFSAIVPQIRAIQNSWASKRNNAEVIQNGRVLMDHITFNLMKANKITAVSAPTETRGFIEFEDNDGNIMRYDVAANNYVEFGSVGSLSELAGPVSQLQFTCYDAFDLDTPIINVNQIRAVKAQATLTNSAALGRDQTFTTQAYILANTLGNYLIEKRTPFEFDTERAKTPALSRIDDEHYLCAYSSNGDDGWAVVLKVDENTRQITKGAPLELDTEKVKTPALSRIDDEHYLCVYSGNGDDGWAVVLTVDTANWTISKGTAFEFDTEKAKTPALSRIDDEHYLCAYSGDRDDGWAVVLTVDTANWTISKGTAFEFDRRDGREPALAKIDDNRYLCAYRGPRRDGWAVVLTVNPATWAISKGTAFEFDRRDGREPALAKIDDDHYLCVYRGPGGDGWAVVLTVNPANWTISKGTAFEFDNTNGREPALAKIDNNYLCAYKGPGDDGWAVVLDVDTDDWTITKGTPFEFDAGNGESPALLNIGNEHCLCAYSGNGDDGWAVVLMNPIVP